MIYILISILSSQKRRKMATYNRKDAYYKKAKKEGYRSRAAYKLKELNTKYKLIKQGNKVLDCGAAPGGWSQVALELVGSNGLVVAIDLNPISDINNKNFKSIVGDFTHDDVIASILDVSDKYNVVISDIAPHTTGIRDTDHYNSYRLVQSVYEFTKEVLIEGGNFIFKLFDGIERQTLVTELKKNFENIKIIRPDATRSGSMEIYIVATKFKM